MELWNMTSSFFIIANTGKSQNNVIQGFIEKRFQLGPSLWLPKISFSPVLKLGGLLWFLLYFYNTIFVKITLSHIGFLELIKKLLRYGGFGINKFH